MQTWWILFAANLLLPLMMLGIGGWFGKHPPRKINHFVGYRTPMSMQNEATWAFAHRACGRLWLRLGAALLPASALGMLCVLGRGEGTVGAVGAGICLAQCAAMLGSIFFVERALRRVDIGYLVDIGAGVEIAHGVLVGSSQSGGKGGKS